MAEIAKPLYAMLSGPKNKKLNWSKEAEAAFSSLKQYIGSPPALRLPDYQRKLVLVTDASDVGAGALLAQRSSDAGLLPVAFHHYTFSDAERRYSNTERDRC